MRRIAAILLCLTATAPLAQQAQRAEVFGAWAVYVADDPRECIAFATAAEEIGWPEDSAGDASQMLVTWRENAAGQVTFRAGGHPVAAGSALALTAAEVRIPMFTDGDWAWTADPADDTRAIEAMGRADSAGMSLVAEGAVPVTVTFALDGFADAAARAAMLCAGA